jgi:hypothetical protein
MSLKQRTLRSFYAKWEEAARASGVTGEEITGYVDEKIREAIELLAGRCPKCSAPIHRIIDKRQDGPSAVAGAWVMYRCSRDPLPGISGGRPCGFAVDLTEVEALN